MIETLINSILLSQQLDGGFGYYKNKPSFIEPTAYCLLALSAFDSRLPEITNGIKWVLSLQNKDGGWSQCDNDTSSTSSATAFALFALKNINPHKHSQLLQHGTNYLEKVRDYRTNQDMDEDAWGWASKAFISIEATAYAVLALKLLNSVDTERIKLGERFFLHNTCDCGGWTYGYPVDKNDLKSAKVYYTPLNPQIHITSLVLMALQNEDTDHSKHFEIIENNYKKSMCPFSLSLSVLALNCYKRDATNILEHLNSLMSEDSYVKKMPYYTGLTALANLTIKTGNNPLCLKT